jgi:hypothetical protein
LTSVRDSLFAVVLPSPWRYQRPGLSKKLQQVREKLAEIIDRRVEHGQELPFCGLMIDREINDA